MTIIYVANDGKTFSTEKDCLLYEASRDCLINNGLIFFDEKGKRINSTIENCFYDSYFVFIKDAVSLKIMQEINSLQNCLLPEETGLWHWDDLNGRWRRAEQEKLYHESIIKEMSEQTDILNKVINEVKYSS